MSMSLKRVASILTLLLLVVAVYLMRHSILEAINLIGSINLWIFLLIIPTQIISFAAIGQVMLSYIKQKNITLKMSWLQRVRIALEINFVDQIVPVPSLAGMTYFSWIMKQKYMVPTSCSMMAYIVRVASSFCCFALAVLISIIALSFDQKVNGTMVYLSALMVSVVFVLMIVVVLVANNAKKLVGLSVALTNVINTIVSKLTFGHKKKTISSEKVEVFLHKLHDDFQEIKKNRKILRKPFMWAAVDCIFDVFLIFIAFWSLGTIVNPAVLFIVYGVCSMIGIVVATPGGVGAVEATMIALYASTGMPASAAIAGTLLARVTLFSGTIIFGYIFYQLTIHKYGKIPKSGV